MANYLKKKKKDKEMAHFYPSFQIKLSNAKNYWTCCRWGVSVATAYILRFLKQNQLLLLIMKAERNKVTSI